MKKVNEKKQVLALFTAEREGLTAPFFDKVA